MMPNKPLNKRSMIFKTFSEPCVFRKWNVEKEKHMCGMKKRAPRSYVKECCEGNCIRWQACTKCQCRRIRKEV